MAMTDFKSVDTVGVDFYAVDTVPQFPLGSLCEGKSATLHSAEFIYLKGVASCVEGSVVTYSQKAFVAVLSAANAIGSVGVAMAPVLASNWGWFQIRGKAAAKVSASFADNGLVYATATAGEIDDAVVAGDRVKQAYGVSAIDTPATGFAYLSIQYPWMDDATAA